MLRLPLDMIAPGMVAARSVSDPARRCRTLVPGNEALSASEVSALRSSGIQAIWVRVEELALLEDMIRHELGTRDEALPCRLRESYIQRLRTTAVDVDVARLQRVWADLFRYLESHRSVEELIGRLLAFDEALATHALDVSFLATLLGLRRESRIARQRRRRDPKADADLHLLALGCLLHDIGKIVTPVEILHKPGRLDRRESAEMKRHTTRGYEMLDGQVDHDVADVALHHHQRWDGRGYPRSFQSPSTGRRTQPLAGEEIPVFARIATVVDVFDAATSRRCYREPQSPMSALEEMHRQARGFFEPNLVEGSLTRALWASLAAWPDRPPPDDRGPRQRGGSLDADERRSAAVHAAEPLVLQAAMDG